MFPIISQWGLAVAIEPEFSSNLPQNLMQSFHHPNDSTYKIWSRDANRLQRYSWRYHFPHYKSIGIVLDLKGS